MGNINFRWLGLLLAFVILSIVISLILYPAWLLADIPTKSVGVVALIVVLVATLASLRALLEPDRLHPHLSIDCEFRCTTLSGSAFEFTFKNSGVTPIYIESIVLTNEDSTPPIRQDFEPSLIVSNKKSEKNLFPIGSRIKELKTLPRVKHFEITTTRRKYVFPRSFWSQRDFRNKTQREWMSPDCQKGWQHVEGIKK